MPTAFLFLSFFCIWLVEHFPRNHSKNADRNEFKFGDWIHYSTPQAWLTNNLWPFLWLWWAVSVHLLTNFWYEWSQIWWGSPGLVSIDHWILAVPGLWFVSIAHILRRASTSALFSVNCNYETNFYCFYKDCLTIKGLIYWFDVQHDKYTAKHPDDLDDGVRADLGCNVPNLFWIPIHITSRLLRWLQRMLFTGQIYLLDKILLLNLRQLHTLTNSELPCSVCE